MWSVLRIIRAPEYFPIEVKQMYSDCTDYVKTTEGRS